MKSITDRSAGNSGAAVAKGFTLPEVIIGVVLLGLMLGSCIGLVNAAKRLWPDRSVAVGGDILPLAPSPAAYADAVRFHGVFLECIESARAIYVFGGSQVGLPASASRVGGAPLATAALPDLGSLPSGMTMDAEAFYQAYASALGPRETRFDPNDFSVLIVGPRDDHLGAIALVQVRRSDVTVSDGSESMNYIRRSARLVSRAETLGYDFAEKNIGPDVAAVGARHFWQRYDEGKVAEEGPVLTIFPDPWLLAGSRLSPHGDGMHPFSQFLYVLPISP